MKQYVAACTNKCGIKNTIIIKKYEFSRNNQLKFVDKIRRRRKQNERRRLRRIRKRRSSIKKQSLSIRINRTKKGKITKKSEILSLKNENNYKRIQLKLNSSQFPSPSSSSSSSPSTSTSTFISTPQSTTTTNKVEDLLDTTSSSTNKIEDDDNGLQHAQLKKSITNLYKVILLKYIIL
jgi:hypothetical protein